MINLKILSSSTKKNYKINGFKKNWPNYNFTFSTSTRAAQILMNDIVIILDYKNYFKILKIYD